MLCINAWVTEMKICVPPAQPAQNKQKYNNATMNGDLSITGNYPLGNIQKIKSWIQIHQVWGSKYKHTHTHIIVHPTLTHRGILWKKVHKQSKRGIWQKPTHLSRHMHTSRHRTHMNIHTLVPCWCPGWRSHQRPVKHYPLRDSSHSRNSLFNVFLPLPSLLHNSALNNTLHFCWHK